MTDVLVFLDTSWPYKQVVDYINYVLQRLNINPYQSSVQLLAASTGTVMVNKTNCLSDLYEQWNVTTHSKFQQGFNMPIVLSTARELSRDLMNEEQRSGSLGGRSLIALVVPSPVAYVTDEDNEYCMRFFHNLNYTAPDLHFLYYTGGAVIRFKDFVWNYWEDLFPLSPDISVERASVPVIERIQKVPRRSVNPYCGGDWDPPLWGPSKMIQYIDLGFINFYRMASNYFPGYASMRFIRIEAISPVTFTVCTSRTVILPYRNGTVTPSGVECAQATMNPVSIDLTDLCVDFDSVTDCPPLYYSVQAQTFGDFSQISCTDPACSSPIQAQFLLYVNNLGCNSRAASHFQRIPAFALFATILMGLLLF